MNYRTIVTGTLSTFNFHNYSVMTTMRKLQLDHTAATFSTFNCRNNLKYIFYDNYWIIYRDREFAKVIDPPSDQRYPFLYEVKHIINEHFAFYRLQIYLLNK